MLSQRLVGSRYSHLFQKNIYIIYKTCRANRKHRFHRRTRQLRRTIFLPQLPKCKSGERRCEFKRDFPSDFGSTFDYNYTKEPRRRFSTPPRIIFSSGATGTRNAAACESPSGGKLLATFIHSHSPPRPDSPARFPPRPGQQVPGYICRRTDCEQKINTSERIGRAGPRGKLINEHANGTRNVFHYQVGRETRPTIAKRSAKIEALRETRGNESGRIEGQGRKSGHNVSSNARKADNESAG